MLILGRSVGESIEIGNDITLTVISIDGKKVRLGFVAPQEVRILRTEIIKDVQNSENKDQGKSDDSH